MKLTPSLLISLLFISFLTEAATDKPSDLKLWYLKPASKWTEALPIGNGRLGAMIFGGVEEERVQFNEETLWTGAPHDYAHLGAFQYLSPIRQLLAEGKQKEAETLAMEQFMSVPLKQKTYQAFGDLKLRFAGQSEASDYHRELDLQRAICRVTYKSNGVRYSREYLSSAPDNVIAIRLMADQEK